MVYRVSWGGWTLFGGREMITNIGCLVVDGVLISIDHSILSEFVDAYQEWVDQVLEIYSIQNRVWIKN